MSRLMNPDAAYPIRGIAMMSPRLRVSHFLSLKDRLKERFGFSLTVSSTIIAGSTYVW